MKGLRKTTEKTDLYKLPAIFHRFDLKKPQQNWALKELQSANKLTFVVQLISVHVLSMTHFIFVIPFQDSSYLLLLLNLTIEVGISSYLCD